MTRCKACGLSGVALLLPGANLAFDHCKCSLCQLTSLKPSSLQWSSCGLHGLPQVCARGKLQLQAGCGDPARVPCDLTWLHTDFLLGLPSSIERGMAEPKSLAGCRWPAAL